MLNEPKSPLTPPSNTGNDRTQSHIQCKFGGFSSDHSFPSLPMETNYNVKSIRKQFEFIDDVTLKTRIQRENTLAHVRLKKHWLIFVKFPKFQVSMMMIRQIQSTTKKVIYHREIPLFSVFEFLLFLWGWGLHNLICLFLAH